MGRRWQAGPDADLPAPPIRPLPSRTALRQDALLMSLPLSNQAQPAGAGRWLAALASAMLTGLACGGLWALASLYSQRPLAWLAVVIGACLAGLGRHWQWPRGPHLTVLAMLACALAIIARLVLLAVLVLSCTLGTGLREVLVHAGGGLLLQVIGLQLDRVSVLYYAAGLIVAAMMARRMSA